LVSQLREELLLCSSYLPLGVPNELFLQAMNEFSGAVAGEEEDFARGVSHAQSFTFFLFCFILFLLASFYQKTKKLVSISSCFLCLV
jgi:hypothetical protein